MSIYPTLTAQPTEPHTSLRAELAARSKRESAIAAGQKVGVFAGFVLSSIMNGSMVGEDSIQVAAFSALTLGATYAACLAASSQSKIKKKYCISPAYGIGVALVALTGGLSVTQAALHGTIAPVIQIASMVVFGQLGSVLRSIRG